MNRLLVLLSSILIVYFVYGFYLSQYFPSIIKPTLKRESSSQFFDYKGAINVHSNLSIGSSPWQQIVFSARQAGLDFIFFTDLNLFDSSDIKEGYHGSTLVFGGAKYSYLDSRLVYYSLANKELGFSLGDAQISLSDLLSQDNKEKRDNFLYLAHPFKSGFTWSGEIPPGLDGVEVINIKSQAQSAWQNSPLSVIWSLLTYPFNPRLAFLRLFIEPTEEWDLFDHNSLKRKFIAYAGSEASARAIPLPRYPIRFPSYFRHFEFLSNHVLLKSELTGKFQGDKQKIFSALKNGQFYLALDILGDPKGFICQIEHEGKVFAIGSEAKFTQGMLLQVALPEEPKDFYEIVIYKDGIRRKVYNQQVAYYEIEGPGVYRVQVRVSPYLPLPDAKRWITWIYTNAFYLK